MTEKKEPRKKAGIYVKPSPEVIELFRRRAEEHRRTLADEVGLYLDETLRDVATAERWFPGIDVKSGEAQAAYSTGTQFVPFGQTVSARPAEAVGEADPTT